MDIAFLITAFATLFVIIDSIGLTPIFVALTTGMSPQQRRQVALRCCLIAVGILLAFGLFGEALLGFVGIGMPAFRISGGVLLFITALDMLFERRQSRREDGAVLTINGSIAKAGRKWNSTTTQSPDSPIASIWRIGTHKTPQKDDARKIINNA